jgi:hypothetical protein
MNKKFLIESIDVMFLDEDEKGNPVAISKQKHPVFEDENGKYVEIYFADIGKRKHYLHPNELQNIEIE